jgi:zinc transport system ATP-binding protein
MGDDAAALVTVTGAAFGYGGTPVVRADALRLAAGRCLGVYGPNGSGKTTLLRGVTGLLPPVSGTVRHRPGLRVGYLAQHRDLQLHWPMTARDAALVFVSAWQRFGRTKGCGAKLDPWLTTLGVGGLAGRPFAALSGGQQQRVLLAGALAADPQVLVLDEPTEGLDASSRRALLQCLREGLQRGLCIVLVSHEVGDLLAAADDVVLLEPARESGGASEVVAVEPSGLLERLATQNGAGAEAGDLKSQTGA